MLVLSTAGITWGQERGKLVSQGEYSAVGSKDGQPKSMKMDEWRMYALEDGSYAVSMHVIPRNQRRHVEERETMAKDLTPETFESDLLDDFGAGHSINIHCDFGSLAIVCRAAFGGVSSSATLSEKKPYVFIPTFEALSLDMSWFSQNIAVQVDRSIGKQTDVPAIGIEDRPDNAIGLKLQETEKLEYLGRENIEVVGQTVSAHKFSLKGPSGGAEENLWLSDSGLLLRLTSADLSVVLTNYQGPPL